MHDERSDTETIRDLVARCLARIETDGEAAIDALCREHPDHAGELRRRVAALRAAGLVDGPLASPAGGSGVEVPERFGEFRLIDRLGGGGMGVVYSAWQESLGREVALKIIRADQLWFPGARERFRREVETIARARHPGIVPVHAFGEDGGVPYFVMERVDGCTLADVLVALRGRDPAGLTGADVRRAVEAHGAGPAAGGGAGDGDRDGSRGANGSGANGSRANGSRDRHSAARNETSEGVWLFEGSWIDTCLRIVRQAADAIEYAHSRGILHRDVKPSNIMLDRTGRVLLLDFGLAHDESAGDGLTRSRAVLGSLPYLAPEVVDGGASDRRVDVYGLGVTLWEMLAVQSPFLDPSSTEATRRNVLAASPPPLRAKNRAVSWEVETVCLTAIERDPARRYASAAALRADLDNVLAHRPIEARRASLLRRAWRWAERHQTVAVAAGLLLLVSIVAPLGFWLQERAARTQIEQQRDRAERNFDRARAAVRTMLSELGGERLENVPQVQPIRRELLAKATALYREFVAERGDDAELRAEFVEVQGVLADMASQLGENDEALAAFAEQRAVLEELIARAPDDALMHWRLCDTLSRVAEIQRGAGDVGGADATYVEALSRCERFPATEQGQRLRLREVATIAAARGQILIGRGDARAAADMLEQALAGFRELQVLEPDAKTHRLKESWVLNQLAKVRIQLGDKDLAERALREALAIREALWQATPDDTGANFALAQSLLESTKWLAQQQSLLPEPDGARTAEIEALLARTSDIAERMVTDFGEFPLSHQLRAITAQLVADHRFAAGRFDEARASVATATESSLVLRERTRDAPVSIHIHAGSLLVGARVANAAGEPAVAREQARGAIALLEPLVSLEAPDPDALGTLCSMRVALAEAELGLGAVDAAVEVLAGIPELRFDDESELRRTALGLLARAAAAVSEEAQGDAAARLEPIAALAARMLGWFAGHADAAVAAELTGGAAFERLRACEVFAAARRRVTAE